MRHRAGRILFTIVAAISLLLCVATCVLWVRSYWRADVAAFRSFHTVGSGRVDSRRFDALSSSARLVVSMNTQQIVAADPSATFAPAPRQQQGWSFGSYPARPPIPPSKPRFNALGVCVDLAWGRETPMKYYFPSYQKGGTVRASSMYLAIPHWMVVLVSAALPAWWWFAHRRKLLRLYRLDRGLCISCGYDLRASAERCPECGTAVAAKSFSPGRVMR